MTRCWGEDSVVKEFLASPRAAQMGIVTNHDIWAYFHSRLENDIFRNPNIPEMRNRPQIAFNEIILSLNSNFPWKFPTRMVENGFPNIIEVWQSENSLFPNFFCFFCETIKTFKTNKQTDAVAKVIEKGYHVLYSADYYIDKQSPVEPNPKYWLYGDTWQG